MTREIHIAGVPALLAVFAAMTILSIQPSAAAMEEHAHHQTEAAATADPHAGHKMAMQTPRYSVGDANYTVPDVELVDANGNSVAFQSLVNSDKPVALNFIFTTCTTICPVMTATFSQMRRALGESADDVELVSVSIDPEYDRPDVLKAYASQFGAGPGWTFLTGDSGDIERVLRSFDAYAGSKLNHKPLTFLKRPGQADWVRIDGLASGESLAQEVTARLLN